MPKQKRIIDARADNHGNITAVKFAGNSRFTDMDRAIKMADEGRISNAHVVHRKGAKPHLRGNPNSSIRDNLDHIAGDDWIAGQQPSI